MNSLADIQRDVQRGTFGGSGWADRCVTVQVKWLPGHRNAVADIGVWHTSSAESNLDLIEDALKAYPGVYETRRITGGRLGRERQLRRQIRALVRVDGQDGRPSWPPTKPDDAPVRRKCFTCERTFATTAGDDGYVCPTCVADREAEPVAAPVTEPATRFCDHPGHGSAIIPEGDETCLLCQGEGRMTLDRGHSWVGFRCERCGIEMEGHEAEPCPVLVDRYSGPRVAPAVTESARRQATRKAMSPGQRLKSDEPKAPKASASLADRLWKAIGQGALPAALAGEVSAAKGIVADQRMAVMLRDQIKERQDLVNAITRNAGLPETPAVTDAADAKEPVTTESTTRDMVAELWRRQLKSLTEQVESLTEQLEGYRSQGGPVAPERPCACGCGQPVTSPRPEARYANGACRVRALRHNRHFP